MVDSEGESYQCITMDDQSPRLSNARFKDSHYQ